MLRNIFESLKWNYFVESCKAAKCTASYAGLWPDGTSRFKKYRRCHGLCVKEVIARFVEVKPLTAYRGLLVGASPSDK